jgi:hypothetical protein
VRTFATFTAARQRVSVLDTITRGPYMAADPNGTPRAFTVVGSYDVPYGRGLRHGTGMSPWLDAIVGHWAADVSSRVQTGQVLRLSGVRLVGMTQSDLQKAFRIRVDPATKTVYDLPQDIIDNTIKAFSSDATTPSGYGSLGAPTGRYIAPASTPTCVEVYPGDCGEPHDVTVTGPLISRVNVSARKSWPAGRHARVEMQLMALNVFAAINFTPVLQASSNSTINQVTSAYQDVPNTFDPGGRTGQIVFRVKW